MSTYPTNGHWEDDPDWQAALDYANDQERHVWPRDRRTPCQNAHCDQLCESLYCSETCREITEGPDHEVELDEATGYSVLPVGAPLPEARASATVKLTIAGHTDILFTMRDHDEAHLLQRLEVLLQRFPVAQASPSTPQCPTHGAMKRSTKGTGWFCPGKLGDGSYCKERQHG